MLTGAATLSHLPSGDIRRPYDPGCDRIGHGPLDRLAASSRANDHRSIIAAERIAPVGFAYPRPAISGALPWIGS